MTSARSTLLLVLVLLLSAVGVEAHREEIRGPNDGSRLFGDAIVVLPNGNYLVTDPDWSAGPAQDRAGAVYLYSGDGILLSELRGDTADDEVGSGGILILPGGHFVVRSPDWDGPGSLDDAGAVTWGNSETGFGDVAVVSAANSLVGTSSGDRVGAQAVVALDNGSYVVPVGGWDRTGMAANAGAVTWCAADGSTVGPVNETNSLVGSQAEDRIGDVTISGMPGVVALRSGHYVVASSLWDNGSIVDAGAATWARNDGSTVGPVSSANSLVGLQPYDHIGIEVQALTNGHYIVQSWLWDGQAVNVGAVTWADGNSPRIGNVTLLNSLVGSQEGDRVGFLAATLSNGHYVVASPLWSNGPIAFAGAVTWRDGGTAHPGTVGTDNSLVGTGLGDSIGYFTNIGIPPLGVLPLANGNYVVASPEWSLSDTVGKVGAVTWANGNGGTVGPVGIDNSLVGSSIGDAIAQYVVSLTSGDYVVGSPFWSQQRGAVTWGSKDGGLIGNVSAANSLVGERTTDFVSANGIARLPDGGYAVPTPRWRTDDAAALGAVTRAPPSGGIAGVVSTQNSFTGSAAGDRAGSGGVVGLANGDLLVRSTFASSVGGLTRVPAGATPDNFIIRAASSLLGRGEDRIGGPGMTRLPGGAIASHSAAATEDNAGAVTLFDAQDPFRGSRPEIDTVRSVVPGGGPALTFAYLDATGTLLVGDPAGNRLVRLRVGRVFHDGFD